MKFARSLARHLPGMLVMASFGAAILFIPGPERSYSSSEFLVEKPAHEEQKSTKISIPAKSAESEAKALTS